MEPVHKLTNFNINEPVEVTCLMPQGIIIVFKVLPKLTLHEFKEEIWKKAEHLPLFKLLEDKEQYAFSGISSKGKPLAMSDETQRICDIKLFFYLFKLEDKKLVNEDGTIDYTKALAKLIENKSQTTTPTKSSSSSHSSSSSSSSDCNDDGLSNAKSSNNKKNNNKPDDDTNITNEQIDEVEEPEVFVEHCSSIDDVENSIDAIIEDKCNAKSDSKDSGLEEMNWIEPPGIK